MAPSGIEHATFRLVAQWLNQLRHQQRAPIYYIRRIKSRKIIIYSKQAIEEKCIENKQEGLGCMIL